MSTVCVQAESDLAYLESSRPSFKDFLEGLREHELSANFIRLTYDGVASRQDPVNYPVKQDSVGEERGHDLSYEATKSSSLKREIRRCVFRQIKVKLGGRHGAQILLPNMNTGMKAPEGMGMVVETADIQNCITKTGSRCC